MTFGCSNETSRFVRLLYDVYADVGPTTSYNKMNKEVHFADLNVVQSISIRNLDVFDSQVFDSFTQGDHHCSIISFSAATHS